MPNNIFDLYNDKFILSIPEISNVCIPVCCNISRHRLVSASHEITWCRLQKLQLLSDTLGFGIHKNVNNLNRSMHILHRDMENAEVAAAKRYSRRYPRRSPIISASLQENGCRLSAMQRSVGLTSLSVQSARNMLYCKMMKHFQCQFKTNRIYWTVSWMMFGFEF